MFAIGFVLVGCYSGVLVFLRCHSFATLVLANLSQLPAVFSRKVFVEEYLGEMRQQRCTPSEQGHTSSIGISSTLFFQNFSSFGSTPPFTSPLTRLTATPSAALAAGCIALEPFDLAFLGFLYTKRSRKWESVLSVRSGLEVMGCDASSWRAWSEMVG